MTFDFSDFYLLLNLPGKYLISILTHGETSGFVILRLFIGKKTAYVVENRMAFFIGFL